MLRRQDHPTVFWSDCDSQAMDSTETAWGFSKSTLVSRPITILFGETRPKMSRGDIYLSTETGALRA